MHVFNKRHISVVVLTLMLSLHVFAIECPTVTLPDNLYKDDKACLAILDERFLSYTPDIAFLSDRNFLLSSYAYANQQLVIDTFYVKYCNLIGEPKWDLSTDQQQVRVDVAKEKLYTRVPFPAPIVDTRDVSSLQPLLKFYVVNNAVTPELFPILFRVDTGAELVLAANHSSEPGASQKYLRDVPFLVTRGNKHFVIVSSVKSYEGALSEVRRLKSRAPQFDFVAYGPYKGNPYHAIMMATWVPYSVAKDALANAREFVNRDSYIWSCPDEGENC